MGSSISTAYRYAAGPVVLSLLALGLTLGLALTVPATAHAGYVLSRFTAPSPPDPAWESEYAPCVSQDKVAYIVSGDDDFRSGYVWQTGLGAAVPWAQFAGCASFDYSDWDPGDVIVYAKYTDEGPHEVWVTNGSLNYKLNLGTGGADYPRISGTRVVWQEWNGANWDIMSAELDIDTLAVVDRTTVCAAAGNQTHPAVAYGCIVWQDHRHGQWEIYGRDLALGGTQRITHSGASQTHPTIENEWVFWQDRRNTGWGSDIYGRRAYVTATADHHWFLGSLRVACHAHGNQLDPSAGWNYVVWTDWRHAADHLPDYPPNTDIRGYRITANAQFVVAGTTDMEDSPDIEAFTVVYAEYSDTHMGAPSSGIVKGANLAH